MAEAKKHGKVRLVLWGFLGVLILFAMIVYLICEQAASVKLPESLKKAPIALPSPRPPAKGAAAKPRLPMLPPSTTQFSDFNAYLQARLARDPGLESARLYLELEKRFQDEEIYKSINSIFPNTYPDRLSPEQIGWVRGKAGLIAQIQRFSRSGPFPSMTTEDRLDALKRTGTSLPVVSYRFFQICSKLLIAEGLIQAQEGNHPAARQALQDVFGLAGMLQGDDLIMGRLILNALASTANRQLTLWIEKGDFPKSDLAPLLALMERFESATMIPEAFERSTAYEYLESRFRLVHDQLALPTWRAPLYGWDRDLNPRDYEAELHLPRMRTSITVPNVPHIVSKAFEAIRNREHSAEALQEYDRVYLKVIESMKHPFPQFIREEEKIMRDIDRRNPRQFLVNAATPNYAEYRTRMLAGETRLHLNRVGLGLQVDPQTTRARRSESLAGDPHHPWRDPFTEKPLQLDETTSPTLVWSLGPDLKDQRGMINYDPSNGTWSEGDLVIRVPR